MDKIYKVVVRASGDVLISVAADGQAMVIYPPGQWAEPPKWLAERGYYLFAFDRLEEAIAAAEDVPFAEVWEAEGDERVEPLPPRMDIFSLRFGTADPDPGEYAPGTIMVRRIQLIRRIWPPEGGNP